ncbi:MAG TPA: PEGA domain-containing protein [Candidatus Eremiobacteraceae bacterium]|nr:PEGA domain-containing protein [Candidatus Eremiobacteraceae bacterium]
MRMFLVAYSRCMAAILIGAAFVASPLSGEADVQSATPTSPSPSATLPPHGGAYITTLPAGAEVWLDGSYLGRTPAFVDDLLPGRHALTVSRSGWNVATASFDVSVGQAATVSLVLSHIASASNGAAGSPGTLDVRGTSGDAVYIDGASAGTLPLERKELKSGFHIVTVVGKQTGRVTRVVEVFPDTASVISVAAPASGSTETAQADDVLAPLASYVPDASVVVSGNAVDIHAHRLELQCTIGSRDYVMNGKAGSLPIAAALVAGKIYLPLSLLQRISAAKP